MLTNILSSGEKLDTSLDGQRLNQLIAGKKGCSAHSMIYQIRSHPVLASKKMQERVASSGFEPHDIDSSLAKTKQELTGLKVLSESHRSDSLSTEGLGDLMFTLVNIGLDERIDLDSALRKANKSFERRFRKVEKNLIYLA